MLRRVLTCVKLCRCVLRALCYVVGGEPDATPLVRCLPLVVASVRALSAPPVAVVPGSLCAPTAAAPTSAAAPAVRLLRYGAPSALAAYFCTCPPSGCIPRRTAYSSALRLAASCCFAVCVRTEIANFRYQYRTCNHVYTHLT